jgi:nitrous oxidase accessory protein NosD
MSRNILRKFLRRSSRRPCRRRSFRPLLEALEDRRLLVTVNAFDNCGTLDDANVCFGEALRSVESGGRIDFAGPGVVRGTFFINRPMVIDGGGQGVVFEGGSTFQPVFDLAVGADRGSVTIRGLTIRPDPSMDPDDLWIGIYTRRGGGGHRIENNIIGNTDPTGPNVPFSSGVGIQLNESQNDIISGNVIWLPHTRNPTPLHLVDSDTSYPTVGIHIQGAIGTTIRGNTIVGNGAAVEIMGGSDIVIGGDRDNASERNVISANGAGIVLRKTKFPIHMQLWRGLSTGGSLPRGFSCHRECHDQRQLYRHHCRREGKARQ